MKILGWIIAAAGGLSILFGASSGLLILFGGHSFDVWSLLGLFFLCVVPGAVGVGLGLWGRHFIRMGVREEAIRFERILRELAAKSNGAFTLEQASHELGCTRDEAERMLRPLVARQVLEMDFLPEGEMTFKLSPLDEARARLLR